MSLAWWRCPNDPPCPHGATLHDVDEPGDPTPRCCVQGCTCGAPAADPASRFIEPEHEESDECWCGPTTIPVERDDGRVAWVIVHHKIGERV